MAASKEIERSYGVYINQVIDEVFEKAVSIGWDLPELAQMSGLCHATVYKLWRRETYLPQLRTVFLLAQAVNMDLPAIKRKIRNLQTV